MYPLPTVLCLLSAIGSEAYGPHHPRGNHRHHRATDGGAMKMTQDQQLLQDKEHIREDLKEVVADDITDRMSPEELEFYYFKIHDADNNTKLDGLEILRAVQHTHHEEEQKDQTEEEPEDFDRIIDLIDRVLEEDDLDRDGYLSYVEYVQGRNKEQNAETQKTKRHK